MLVLTIRLLTYKGFAVELKFRDVIAFPKTQQARCPLTNAPASVDAKQLKDLEVISTYKPKAE